jgi:hypothetical protein
LYTRRPTGKKAGKQIRLVENENEKESRDSFGPSNADGDTGGRGRGKGLRKPKFKDLIGEYEFSSDVREPLDSDPTVSTEEPLFDMKDVKGISLYGRDEPTMSELARDMFILRLLEGRASLRGPDYEDCEFIRRVWFPAAKQLATGQARKEKNAPPTVRKRHDWIDDSWDDDTDEEEAARRKNQAPASELVDYDTEDDDLGHDLKPHEIIAQLAENVNDSQLRVIGRVTAPNPRGRTRATLVHGPPGTGKTTTISAAVIRLVKAGEPVWIIAQSNVGIRNVADKLRRVEFEDFLLIVAQDYFNWW